MEEESNAGAGAAHASSIISAAGASAGEASAGGVSAGGASAGGEGEGCPAGMQKNLYSKGPKWVTPEKALQEMVQKVQKKKGRAVSWADFEPVIAPELLAGPHVP